MECYSLLKFKLPDRVNQDEYSSTNAVPQCLPVKIPSKQFLEWDRLIARYLWQGKRARSKFRTLQLRKEKGGLGLPCLQEYYNAAQLRPLV